MDEDVWSVVSEFVLCVCIVCVGTHFCLSSILHEPVTVYYSSRTRLTFVRDVMI